MRCRLGDEHPCSYEAASVHEAASQSIADNLNQFLLNFYYKFETMHQLIDFYCDLVIRLVFPEPWSPMQ